MDSSEQSHSHTQQASNRLVGEDFGILEDIEIEELERETQTEKESISGKKRKSPSTQSTVWEQFTPVTIETGDPPQQFKKARCKRCGSLLAADSKKNGTTALKKHSVSCMKKQEATKSQSVLNLQPNADGSGEGTLTSWKFDQQTCRIKLCEMIIRDELPFKFVEREGFKSYTESLCPQFKIPSRHTIRADCVKLFMERKINLKSFFQAKGMGRVSITTDCWTAINNTNFICVTAHCIDKDWVLHKNIINFRKITSHKGDDLGASVISSLEDWGLEKVLCCTMDNASANDGAIKHMIPVLERWKTSVVGGKYLHMRCAAHIINLVVSDGLEEIGLSVRRVREAVKWIKASPARSEGFKGTLQVLKIDSAKFLCLDVPTRWNSTYLMLESALPYADAIKFFGTMTKGFSEDLRQKKYKDQPIGVPEEQDWANVKRMISYLGKFYALTLLVSGTTYSTSHLLFKEMSDVFDLISQMELHEDDDISQMALRMRRKIGKYWLEEENELNLKMNKILYIAALLDPRQKLKHVEKCLRTVYGDKRATELVVEINNSLHELFDFYKRHMTSSPAPIGNAYASNLTMGVSDDGGAYFQGSCSLLEVIDEDDEPEVSDVSEIAIYFTEKQYKMKRGEVGSFDLLQWWMKNGPRFPVLSEMARDILAIPISSVASESAFSTGGRVLSQFRSSLTPNMVEALICAEDWLKSSSSDIFLRDEEDVPETELEKEYQMVLDQLGVGSGPSGRERHAGQATGSAASQAIRKAV